MEVVKDL